MKQLNGWSALSWQVRTLPSTIATNRQSDTKELPEIIHQTARNTAALMRQVH